MTSHYKPALPIEIIKADLDNFFKFFNEFTGESDRAAVILGTAKLDQLLCDLLTSFFIPNTSSKDELFDVDTPLSSFHSKILLAHRLGLIDRCFIRALQIIRKIRNSFAHETSGCTLETHKNRITELMKLFTNNDQISYFKDHFLKEYKGASRDFRCALAMIVLRLEGAIMHISSISDNKPWTLDAPKAEPQKSEAGPVDPGSGK